jgi:predicted DNA-binding transcriptional regulator YafY
MGQTERLYLLRRKLNTGRVVQRKALLRDLEVSPATLKRDIAKLRDSFDLPILWDVDLQGWRLVQTAARREPLHEMPGLLFTAEELHALLAMQHLLGQLDMGGLLGPHIQPMAKRVNALLKRGSPGATDPTQHIRLAHIATRRVHLPQFQVLGHALLTRKRITITHHSRERDETTERQVSPQRLINYRGNWYLDAWCHWRDGLRSFSVDAVKTVKLADDTAIDIDSATLDAELGAGYGIFAGCKVRTAKLRFSAARSRWVAAEAWHPDQQGTWDAQKRWTLTLPYADPRELVMDILRHVPEVEVLAPKALRSVVLENLKLGICTVGSGSSGDPADQDNHSRV